MVENIIKHEEIEQVIAQHQRFFQWEINRAGVPSDEKEDVLAEINLYVVEQYHRYNPERASVATFLHWQCRGAIKRHYRRESRYFNHLAPSTGKDEEGEDSNILDTLIDPSQIDGRQIEEQIIQKEMIKEVILFAKDNGIKMTKCTLLSQDQSFITLRCNISRYPVLKKGLLRLSYT